MSDEERVPGLQVEPRRRGIGAIETGMRLIDCLAEAEGPMQLKEIAAASDIPAAKAHRYLASFIAAGMVIQPEGSNRYDLGPMAIRVGVAALNRIDVVERACSGLQQLRDEIRATCFVTAWTDKGPIILRWEDSQRPITVIVEVGSAMPLLTSATGRTYLAFLPRERTAQLAKTEIAGAARSTDKSSDMVASIVSETREAGLGRTDGDFQAGVAALSAPLFDPAGQMVGAVTALGRQSEFDANFDGAIARSLRNFTHNLVGGNPR